MTKNIAFYLKWLTTCHDIIKISVNLTKVTLPMTKKVTVANAEKRGKDMGCNLSCSM